MQCKVCWKDDPPHQWERSQVRGIPKTKHALLETLTATLPDRADLPNLLKDELVALFRKHVRGERHGLDPLRGASKLTRDELVERLSLHDIPIKSSDKKGDMLLKLRDHWNQQCALAKSQSSGVVSSISMASQECDAISWEMCVHSDN